MSFVVDQIRRVDGQLDRLQLSSAGALGAQTSSAEHPPAPSPHILHLQSLVKSLSTNPSARNPLLSSSQIRNYLSAAGLDSNSASAATTEQDEDSEDRQQPQDEYEQELQWLVVSKATVQVYGLVLSRLLDETVALADDVWYWDEILNKQYYTALYSIQVSPFKFMEWGSNVWTDVQQRARNNRFNMSEAGANAQQSVTDQWRQFYGLVKEVVRDRSIYEMKKRVVSPVQRIRSEVRQKQANLKKCRLRGANALGILLGEGLMNESVHGEGLSTPDEKTSGRDKWKASVARNVAIMDAVLAKVNEKDLSVDKFDAAIAEETDEDPLYEIDIYGEGTGATGVQASAIADRLMRLLDSRIPEYTRGSKAAVTEHGRPSKLIRYWFPITLGILSSSTVLRIVVNRRAEIITWIQELGHTMLDFWTNWVVEPTRNLIKTIRHDEGSEVSIMSKRSLEGDRASLERMVVDFAVDNPGNATDTGNPLTEAEIADIRAKIREGDLTPVLKAYEKDLASPFMGTVRGNLIRALLIQIQKTKVDVEVAIGGIDALLKSQELVFGLVGLTPGVIVCIGLTRWLQSSFSSRKGIDQARKQGQMTRQLRNIDRVLTNSTPTDFGELYYKDHGLLLCEVHVLRQEARRVMPGQVFREFVEDIEELVDVRTGVKKQMKVVHRIRWAYKRYF
ncbi:hypothetical protein AAFC00_001396 [Neodothiora populina]|uniref:ATP synthase regulation protein NCA2 n=1 Tax=Neodothiora populina TaxID=2781224 RepID=A0ABR3PNU0_9PEZI